MNKDLVSIIIPCYNYGDYLDDAIHSALNQTYINNEIIIIDDGSTDNSKQIALKYKDQLTYYYKSNGGDSSARNYGITKANGMYIVFLDADNKLHHNFIENTIKILKNNPKISFVYTQLQFFGDENFITKFIDYDFEKLKYNNFIDGCSLMNKKVYEYAQYDESYRVFQDWDFYLTLGEKGIKGKLLNEPLIYYRKHDRNAIDFVKKGKEVNKRRSYIKFFLKHKNLYNPFFIARWVIGDIIYTTLEIISLKKT